MATIEEIRQQYPQYENVSDSQLAIGLYKKFYAGQMHVGDFLDRVGIDKGEALYELRAADDLTGDYLRQELSKPLTGETQEQTQMRTAGGLSERRAGTGEGVARAALQGATFGFGDELVAASAAMLDPFVRGDQGRDFGERYQAQLGRERSLVEGFREDAPIAAYGAEVAGSIPTAMVGGGQLLGRGGTTLGQRALMGAGVGAAQGAVYGAGAAGGDLEDRATGAAIGGTVGGVVGAVAPYIGSKFAQAARNRAQTKAVDVAIQGTPSAESLRSSAGAMFDKVRHSGTRVANEKVQDFVARTGQALKSAGADRDITPGGIATYRRMVEDLAGEITLPKIHVWRQLAGNAAMGKGSDTKMGTMMIRMLDDFVDNLKPGDLSIGPSLFRGRTQPIQKTFLEAIATYRRASKMATLESAITKAAEYQSGFESGLRNQFGNILKSETLSRGFSEVEKNAMRRVSRGTFGSNMLRFLGTFGIPTDQARNWFGALASGAVGGQLGGLPGAAAMLGGGTAARAGASKMIQSAADRAVRVVGTTNLPNLPPINQAIRGGAEKLIQGAALPIAGPTLSALGQQNYAASNNNSLGPRKVTSVSMAELRAQEAQRQ